MQTPKRTLSTLLVAATLAALTLVPLASPARAAVPGPGGPAVTDIAPWTGWLSGLAERLAGFVGWPGLQESEDSPVPLTSQAGGIADPDGKPTSDDDCEDCPGLTTQEGGIADPNG